MQFGGQTAIKLTEALMKMGVNILGTSAEDVDAAEDRELFDKILEECIFRDLRGIQYIRQTRRRLWQIHWDILCLSVLPTCSADRACRLP